MVCSRVEPLFGRGGGRPPGDVDPGGAQHLEVAQPRVEVPAANKRSPRLV